MKKSLKESDALSSSNESKTTRAKRKRRRTDSVSSCLWNQESESDGEKSMPQFIASQPVSSGLNDSSSGKS